jgi:hypothetical protein
MGLNFIGQFFGCVGIGNHSRYFAEALLNNIDDVRLNPLTPNINYDMFGLTPKLNANFKACEDKYPTLAFWYPDAFGSLFQRTPKTPRKIGYYVFEYTKIPETYIAEINKLNDICTPSKWGKETLIKNGVTIPVHVVPGGVDTNIFNSTGRKLDEKTFKFIHVGKAEKRKSTEQLIEAFANAFGGNPNVSMTMYIHNVHIQYFNSYKYVYDVLDRIGKKDIISQFNIKNFVENIADEYRSHNVAIFPSKSEGLGMPTLEAMACGVPTITTFNTAMMDYANDDNTILIKDMSEQLVQDPHFFPIAGSHGTWLCPSVGTISEKMKWAYDNYSEAEKIGMDAEVWVRNNYTWDLAAKEFIKIL